MKNAQKYKQDRGTPSTQEAELFAWSRSLEETRWMRSMWVEANHADYKIADAKWDQQVPIPPLRATSHCSTTRIPTTIPISRTHGIWVALCQMIAGDILTKRGVPVDLLLRVLEWGKFMKIRCDGG